MVDRRRGKLALGIWGVVAAAAGVVACGKGIECKAPNQGQVQYCGGLSFLIPDTSPRVISGAQGKSSPARLRMN